MRKAGEFVVKGLAYEDVVSILGNNGYATEVFTPQYEYKNVMEVEHRISVYDCRCEMNKESEEE